MIGHVFQKWKSVLALWPNKMWQAHLLLSLSQPYNWALLRGALFFLVKNVSQKSRRRHLVCIHCSWRIVVFVSCFVLFFLGGVIVNVPPNNRARRHKIHIHRHIHTSLCISLHILITGLHISSTQCLILLFFLFIFVISFPTESNLLPRLCYHHLIVSAHSAPALTPQAGVSPKLRGPLHPLGPAWNNPMPGYSCAWIQSLQRPALM